MTLDDLVLSTRVTLGMRLPPFSPFPATDQHYLSPVQPNSSRSWGVSKDTAEEGLLRTEGCSTHTEAVWAKEMCPLDYHICAPIWKAGAKATVVSTQGTRHFLTEVTLGRKLRRGTECNKTSPTYEKTVSSSYIPSPAVGTQWKPETLWRAATERKWNVKRAEFPSKVK